MKHKPNSLLSFINNLNIRSCCIYLNGRTHLLIAKNNEAEKEGVKNLILFEETFLHRTSSSLSLLFFFLFRKISPFFSALICKLSMWHLYQLLMKNCVEEGNTLDNSRNRIFEADKRKWIGNKIITCILIQKEKNILVVC